MQKAAIFLAKFTEDHINHVIRCSEKRPSPQELHVRFHVLSCFCQLYCICFVTACHLLSCDLSHGSVGSSTLATGSGGLLCPAIQRAEATFHQLAYCSARVLGRLPQSQLGMGWPRNPWYWYHAFCHSCHEYLQAMRIKPAKPFKELPSKTVRLLFRPR
jgi:hypothetical protein